MLASAAALVPAVASALERVRMPYACSLEGQRVVLTPSPERTYRIIGAHEQQPFTACSPADRSRCRTWMLHRFDFDCGGARVSWLSAVAAASKTRRVWVENGSLHQRFWIERFDANGDPCFGRPRRAHEGWPGQGSFLYNRACGPFRAREATTVVSMPHGFAPLMDLRARFVPGPASAAAPQISAGQGDTSAEPSGGGEKHAIAVPKPVLVSPAQRGEGAAMPHPLSQPAGRSDADVDPPDAIQPKTVWPDAALAIGLIGALACALAGLAWTRSRSARRVDPAAAPVSTGARDAVGAPTGPPVFETTSEEEAGEELLRTAETFFEHVAHIAERIRARDALRDVVSDEMRAIETTLRSPELARAYAIRDWSYVRACAVQILTDLERVRRVAQSANEAPVRTHAIPLQHIPCDRREALAVLGVNADASEKVVKKIVDAMRQTWHPDLARDEADRLTREARIKQINSAWDLVRNRPHEMTDAG